MRFDTLQPGATLGDAGFEFTEAALSEWTALFPADSACRPVMPPAMIAMVVMRAYMALMHDRPPGNVHAGQKFEIARLPSLNETMTTGLRCLSKDLRNGRRWVTFGTLTRDRAGLPLFSGEMTMLWAQ
jgi:hypothetical protein